MRQLMILALATTPAVAFAAGSSDDDEPLHTNTTKTCTDGQVWDAATESCVDAQSGALDDDQRYEAVRELAYAGQYINAQKVLAAMSDQSEDRVLTYMGFTHRRMGAVELGNAYYRQAIAKNPGNLLARSYMGQGFIEAGDFVGARAQLLEIRALGGGGTWAELSLMRAIDRGTGYSH